MVHSLKDYLNVVVTFSIAYAVALACSIGGLEYNGFSIILICMLISFFVHWMAFIPSFFLKTEKYYDISGIRNNCHSTLKTKIKHRNQADMSIVWINL